MHPSLSVLTRTLNSTHLVLWQIGKGLYDSRQGNLALFGQVSSAGKGVGGAAHKPGARIAWSEQNKEVTPQGKGSKNCSTGKEKLYSAVEHFTLVLYSEVSGDQRWDLSSDIGGENLPFVLFLVMFDHLGLKKHQQVIN